MPTYEYKCENCGRFERFEKITAEPLTECPTCKGKVHRVISAVGVIFKGSGFYITDNRSSEYKKAANEASKEKNSSDSKKAS
ncbi:FmdB family transcriptional regulator [Anoxybacter fermentans]|uniref:FmdB family transcriptional regulator n=1 Tax=Anoxybacter fermentans TaxID=1323375 RepID=A0A3Q9HNV3_9FIRM|nr:FmdB family zinc ribbon protein [Anoxybacter fermentans]AZR72141.1 FmdB family transcriptional regulator [Anoxybacter fermentans]